MMATSNNVPSHISKRKTRGGKRFRKRRVAENQIQLIARANREEEYDESSGSESDEWYEGDEFDDYAFGEGGYFRVEPGDVLNKRYEVYKRLGWGHFSQVYLCKDRETDQHVAAKIQKTGEEYIKAGEEEVTFHQAINEIEVEESHICRMKDYFDVYSNRGKHIIMIFEIMSACLFDLLFIDEDQPGLPLGVVKCITKETLSALTELHAAGLIHTDLKPENVMLNAFKEVDSDSINQHKQLFEFKKVQVEISKCKDKLERGGLNKNQRKRLKQRIAKMEKKIETDLHLLTLPSKEETEAADFEEALIFMGQSVSDHQKANVKVVDLGTACWQKDRNDYEIGTRNYRSPECILGHRFDQRIDVWAVACMVVELINGEILFDPDEEDEDNEFDNTMRNLVHLKQIWQCLGKIPKPLQAREYFNRRGELLNTGEVEVLGLQSFVREKIPALDEDDINDLCDFLSPMLTIDPAQRIDAQTALEHPWLNLTSVDTDDVKAWVEDFQMREDDEEDEYESDEDEEK